MYDVERRSLSKRLATEILDNMGRTFLVELPPFTFEAFINGVIKDWQIRYPSDSSNNTGEKKP